MRRPSCRALRRPPGPAPVLPSASMVSLVVVPPLGASLPVDTVSTRIGSETLSPMCAPAPASSHC